jgi:hypothetical protein
MVKLLQMADTGEGTTPLHVNLEEARASRGAATSYGMVAELYSNEHTGERVQMCWVDSDKSFSIDRQETDGGEELFIVDGSLRFGNSGEQYTKWGWLRFPVGGTNDEQRSLLKAGSDGARVFRKTGHLTEKALSMEKIQITEE